MIVLGDITLSNVEITGSLTAGLINFDSLNNSIETLGAPCYNPSTDQKDAQLCSMQTLHLQKNLAGNVDLFDGAIVLEPDGSVNIEGTLAADKVEAGSYAIKETSELVGSSTLAAGDTEIVIENTNVQEDSKVFITPTTSTGGQTLIVSQKTEGESFTVSIETAIENDITFDWWILDVSSEQP